MWSGSPDPLGAKRRYYSATIMQIDYVQMQGMNLTGCQVATVRLAHSGSGEPLHMYCYR